MVQLFGRSQYTLNKPIKQGYKILALCEKGYTYNWIYTSCTQGFANISQYAVSGLSPTSSAVIHLCKPLPSQHARFHLYMDNYFGNISLFRHLYSNLSISACGTLRLNYIPVKLKEHFDKTTFKNVPWNDISAIETSDPQIQILRWKDNSMVKINPHCRISTSTQASKCN